MAISNQTIETISSTVPILRIHGQTIASVMYKNLFMKYPELLNMYNQSNHAQGLQQTSFANTLIVIAENIRQVDTFLPSLVKINHKHVSVGVEREQYPLIAECLMDSMREVLGRGSATERFVSAWSELFAYISDQFIRMEKEIYRNIQKQPGGWIGFKKFIIVDKVKESDVITSFYLKPADHSIAPLYKPGQYITVKLRIPGETYLYNRQYSLSCAPGRGYFRITVKNESEYEPYGKVSSYLHQSKQVGDMLEISAPTGTFSLDIEASSPLTLISGGVGITPMISILDTLVMEKSDRKTTLIHAARNESVHAFARESAELITKLKNGSYVYGYEEPKYMYSRHDFKGLINEKVLKPYIDKETKYYVCGPYPFMRKVIAILTTKGISHENIFYDFFAPQLPVEEKVWV